MKSFDEFCKKHELTRNLDYVELAWNTKQAEVDELRERIEGAIYDLQHIESAMWEEQVEHVLMILKGNKDEN